MIIYFSKNRIGELGVAPASCCVSGAGVKVGSMLSKTSEFSSQVQRFLKMNRVGLRTSRLLAKNQPTDIIT